MDRSLNYETCRYKTFAQFPLRVPSKCTLALAGFYFVGPVDDVRCQFCKVLINGWGASDNVFHKHKLFSPHCPLMMRQKTNNVPSNVTLFETLLMQPQMNCSCCIAATAPLADQSSINATTSTSVVAAAAFVSAVFPSYASEIVRFSSYASWPSRMNPVDLARAGFFYTMQGDRVKCFSCGIGLCEWHLTDKPWEQHALYNSTCSFLIREKGAEYIKNVILSAKEKKNIKNHIVDISCTICVQKNYNTVFIPCNHAAACVECAGKLAKCPICQNEFERYIVIYLC